MGLNHVALTVSDRTRSAEFYGEHFGMIEKVHDDDHLLILSSAEGGLLALDQGDPPAELGKVHFGFQASGADEVHAARERLRSAGVEEAEWQDDGKFVRVQVIDPDGYRVDFYAY